MLSYCRLNTTLAAVDPASSLNKNVNPLFFSKLLILVLKTLTVDPASNTPLNTLSSSQTKVDPVGIGIDFNINTASVVAVPPAKVCLCITYSYGCKRS